MNIFSNNCVGACFMYRADIAKEAGKYSADWFLVEDYEYWLRIRNISKIGHIDELLYKYRHHQRSLSETRMIQVREKLYDLRLNMIQKSTRPLSSNCSTEASCWLSLPLGLQAVRRPASSRRLYKKGRSLGFMSIVSKSWTGACFVSSLCRIQLQSYEIIPHRPSLRTAKS